MSKPKLASKLHKYFFVRKNYTEKQISGIKFTKHLQTLSEDDAVEAAVKVLKIKKRNYHRVKKVARGEAIFIGRDGFFIYHARSKA